MTDACIVSRFGRNATVGGTSTTAPANAASRLTTPGGARPANWSRALSAARQKVRAP